MLVIFAANFLKFLQLLLFFVHQNWRMADTGPRGGGGGVYLL